MSAKQNLIILLAAFLLALAPIAAPAQEGGNKPAFPQAAITSEGMVKAYPDIAVLHFTIITESPKAQTASTENARKAESFLNAAKKFLHEGDTIKSTGYRITPLYTYGDKGRKPAVTGYRVNHGFQVRIKELARLGDLIDLAVGQGVNEINGPFWQHAALDELTRQASVEALQKAKLMAEALAGSQGLKVKRLYKVSTGARVVPYPRDEVKVFRAAAGSEAVATPIEVGEQEIRAQIEAVFELE